MTGEQYYQKGLAFEKDNDVVNALDCYLKARNEGYEFGSNAADYLQRKALTSDLPRVKNAMVAKLPTVYALNSKDFSNADKQKMMLYIADCINNKNHRFLSFEDFRDEVLYYKSVDFYKDYRTAFLQYIKENRDYAGAWSVFKDEFDFIENTRKDYVFELRFLKKICKKARRSSNEYKEAYALRDKYFIHKFFAGWERRDGGLV